MFEKRCKAFMNNIVAYPFKSKIKSLIFDF